MEACRTFCQCEVVTCRAVKNYSSQVKGKVVFQDHHAAQWANFPKAGAAELSRHQEVSRKILVLVSDRVEGVL